MLYKISDSAWVDPAEVASVVLNESNPCQVCVLSRHRQYPIATLLFSSETDARVGAEHVSRAINAALRTGLH